MWKWVIAQNVARLEKQLSECNDERQRAVLPGLLDREKNRLKSRVE